MPIVNSAYAVDPTPQSSGHYRITERHTDSLGRVHKIVYLNNAGWSTAQIETKLAERAAQLNQQLADAEAEGLVDDGS